MSEHAITSTVADEKDVDGFGAINIGELAKRGGRPLFTPCTPLALVISWMSSSSVLDSGTLIRVQMMLAWWIRSDNVPNITILSSRQSIGF
jgi:hypothetical protein